MKYLLDLILVVCVVGLGYLWNGEKKNSRTQSDQIDQLYAAQAKLELDLKAAQASGEKLAADLAALTETEQQLRQEWEAQKEALAAKTAEADELRQISQKLKERVDELQGYKDRASKAIIAEKPPPAGQP